MHGAGVNQAGKRHLVYAPQPLVPGVPNHLHYQWVPKLYEPINRVVHYFSFGAHAAQRYEGGA